MLVIEASPTLDLGPMSAVDFQRLEGGKMAIDKATRIALKEYRKNTVM